MGYLLMGLRDEAFNYFRRAKRRLLGTKALPILQLHLAEHCNLNCKGCAHFSPLAEESFVDVDLLEETYRHLAPNVDGLFARIELMGGEPLLHPRAENIISITRRHFPHMQIRIVTNGTLLPTVPESFYDCCVANDAIVAISTYPIPFDYKQAFGLLRAHGVNFVVYGSRDGQRSFYAYLLDSQGKRNGKKNYRCCRAAGRHLQLKDGRIYPCYISAYANHLNDHFGTAFAWEAGDFFAVNEGFDPEEFRRFASNPVPFCRYCANENEMKFDWALSKKDPAEWLVNLDDKQVFANGV